MEKTRMESKLTQPAIDAALQLINLKSNSARDFNLLWTKIQAKKEGERYRPKQDRQEDEENERRSVSLVERLPSRVILDSRKCMEEDLVRRKRKFRPIHEIYRDTQPLMDRNGGYRAKKSKI